MIRCSSQHLPFFLDPFFFPPFYLPPIVLVECTVKTVLALCSGFFLSGCPLLLGRLSNKTNSFIRHTSAVCLALRLVLFLVHSKPAAQGLQCREDFGTPERRASVPRRSFPPPPPRNPFLSLCGFLGVLAGSVTHRLCPVGLSRPYLASKSFSYFLLQVCGSCADSPLPFRRGCMGFSSDVTPPFFSFPGLLLLCRGAGVGGDVCPAWHVAFSSLTILPPLCVRLPSPFPC